MTRKKHQEEREAQKGLYRENLVVRGKRVERDKEISEAERKRKIKKEETRKKAREIKQDRKIKRRKQKESERDRD